MYKHQSTGNTRMRVICTQDAIDFGANAAFVINHMWYQLDAARTKGRNIKDGRVWIYDSAESLLKQFPFMSIATLKRILKKLKEEGVLITGNFNKHGYDRTTWYSMPEFAIDTGINESTEYSQSIKTRQCKNQNDPESKSGSKCNFYEYHNDTMTEYHNDTMKSIDTIQAIPLDSTKDFLTEDLTIYKGEQVAEAEASDTDDKNESNDFAFLVKAKVAKKYREAVMEVLNYWSEKMDFRFNPEENSKSNQKRAQMLCERLKEYSMDLPLMKQAIDACAASEWHMGDNPQRKKYNDIQYIFHPDKFERHLNNGTTKYRQHAGIKAICEKYGGSNENQEIDITPNSGGYKLRDFNF